jgi:hypothetical protein
MPSDLRHLDQVHRLLAQLDAGDMQAGELARVLGTPASRIRRHILELCRAGVIHVVPAAPGAARGEQPRYRLSPDQERGRAFLKNMMAPPPGRAASAEGAAHASRCRQGSDPLGQRFHEFSGDTSEDIFIDQHLVRRDPLVAALFGAARQ